MSEIPYYWKSVDWDSFMADYPPPPMFETSTGQLSDDEIHSLQEERFLARVADAWDTRFYRERWTAAGLKRGDIRGLEDIEDIPTFNSDDLKKAIEDAPPFGTHHPLSRSDLGRTPIKIQTSGGTTGMPRTTLFDQIAWEVQGVQFARALWAQGGRPGDIFQIPFTTALGNAAWSATVGIFHWLGGVPVNSGSGVVTPTKRQMEFAQLWGTNVWVSFGGGEYLLKLHEAAVELGIDVQRDLPLKYIHAYLGVDTSGTLRNLLQSLWGVPVYDNYGTHEIGIVSFECPHQNGMHVNEDTVVFQVHDVDSGAPLAAGQAGNLIATSLHRNVPPIIRYNLRDRLAQFPRSTCECGLRTAKLSGFQGRTDEMIKLRGQNVYPRACQEAILEDSRTTGEYLVVVTNRPDRAFSEDMVIRIERRDADIDTAELSADMVRVLHDTIGVRVDVEIVEPGTLAEFTSLGGEGKVKRLLDLRTTS
jgi:phenylacetate-CoA ligase